MSALRPPHDIGGEPAGPCPRARHEVESWERRVDGIMMILWRRGAGSTRFTVDEMRRQIESMSPADYRDAGYYERWMFALAGMLIERGVLTTDEIDGRMNIDSSAGGDP